MSFLLHFKDLHFLSNGIKNMCILASGPELEAVRFGYIILGENGKNESDP
jgi:hypothetical protein